MQCTHRSLFFLFGKPFNAKVKFWIFVLPIMHRIWIPFNWNGFRGRNVKYWTAYEITRSIYRFYICFFFLFCRGKPVHLTTNEDEAIVSATDEEPSVIVQLSNRVQDGTRCRIGSLDMCIQGRCQVILLQSLLIL